MADPRDPLRERLRVALAFAVAVLPPLVLLAWLAYRSAEKDGEAVFKIEQERTRNIAQRTRDALVLAVREAEESCFPRDLGGLRSRDPRARAELEKDLDALRVEHPIARRFLALDEDAKTLLPDPRAPFRPEGSPPVEEPDEDRATDPVQLARRRAARKTYEATRELEKTNAAEAAASFQTLGEDVEASPVVRARSWFRRARLLEAAGRFEDAAAAYARAAAAPAPVRDEEGVPIISRSALREAELLDKRDRAEAFKRARDHGLSLLAGEHRDLAAAEWADAFAGVKKLLDTIGAASSGNQEPESIPEADRLSTGSRLLVAKEKEMRERLSWVAQLEGSEIGEPLRSALVRERADELLHIASLRNPPVFIAYRVLPTLALEPGAALGLRTNRLVFGIELDLERLAKDVLRPACGKESLEQDVALAVIDGHGLVAHGAYAGAESAPDANGRRRPTDAVTAMVSLDPLPWQLEVRRSSAAVAKIGRSRVVLFGGLFALALVATALGGLATWRSVSRSLELARMKQDFVSNVTHELKTPLTSIRMYAETLSLGRYRDEEKKKEYLQHIIRESERLQRLIDDILDFARIGEGKKPYVLAEGDVTEVTLEAIDLFRHSMTQRGFELYLDLPALGALPPVDLDRDALVRAILNLLSNAVKYSPDSHYVSVSVKREGDMLATAVEDKGMGISKEDLERVFDRFFRAGDHMTRGIPGAGLGLSLVDEIVRAHGGRIVVESEKGKGSKFTILLPIVEDYRNVAWPPADSGEEIQPVDAPGAAGVGSGADEQAGGST